MLNTARLHYITTVVRLYCAINDTTLDNIAFTLNRRQDHKELLDVVASPTMTPKKTPACRGGAWNEQLGNQAGTASCFASLAVFSSSAAFRRTASNARISNVDVGLPSLLR